MGLQRERQRRVRSLVGREEAHERAAVTVHRLENVSRLPNGPEVGNRVAASNVLLVEDERTVSTIHDEATGVTHTHVTARTTSTPVSHLLVGCDGWSCAPKASFNGEQSIAKVAGWWLKLLAITATSSVAHTKLPVHDADKTPTCSVCANTCTHLQTLARKQRRARAVRIGGWPSKGRGCLA